MNNYKVFAFVVVLLYVSSALAEEAFFQDKNRKVAQHKSKVDSDPTNDVEDGGRPFPGYVGGGAAPAVEGGPSTQCKWACCGFGYRGYCSECCDSPEEAKAFMESAQAID